MFKNLKYVCAYQTTSNEKKANIKIVVLKVAVEIYELVVIMLF